MGDGAAGREWLGRAGLLLCLCPDHVVPQATLFDSQLMDGSHTCTCDRVPSIVLSGEGERAPSVHLRLQHHLDGKGTGLSWQLFTHVRSAPCSVHGQRVPNHVRDHGHPWGQQPLGGLMSAGATGLHALCRLHPLPLHPAQPCGLLPECGLRAVQPPRAQPHAGLAGALRGDAPAPGARGALLLLLHSRAQPRRHLGGGCHPQLQSPGGAGPLRWPLLPRGAAQGEGLTAGARGWPPYRARRRAPLPPTAQQRDLLPLIPGPGAEPAPALEVTQ